MFWAILRCRWEVQGSVSRLSRWCSVLLFLHIVIYIYNIICLWFLSSWAGTLCDVLLRQGPWRRAGFGAEHRQLHGLRRCGATAADGRGICGAQRRPWSLGIAGESWGNWEENARSCWSWQRLVHVKIKNANWWDQNPVGDWNLDFDAFVFAYSWLTILHNYSNPICAMYRNVLNIY